MAPFVGPGKQEVLKQLRHHKRDSLVRITLGRGDPQFVIQFANNHYELSPLESNSVIREQVMQQGHAEGYLVPEMLWASLSPGTPIIQESELRTFLLELDAWPGWPEVVPYVFDRKGNLLDLEGNIIPVDNEGRIIGHDPYTSGSSC